MTAAIAEPGNIGSKPPTRPLLGVLVALLVVSLLVVPVFLPLEESGEPELGIFVSILLVGLIGGFLVAKRPDHPISWLLSATAIAGGIAGFAALALPDGVSSLLWWQSLLAIVSGPVWYSVLYMVLVLVPLLFPTGQALSPRWRLVGWGAGVAGGIFALMWALQERFCTNWTPADVCIASVPNPVGVAGVQNPEETAIGTILLMVILLGALLAFTSLVQRYRRSGPAERHQIKWVAFTIGLFITIILLVEVVWVDLLGNTLPPGSSLVQQVLWVMIPASIAVAILRYRLYDIDVVISRTVVFTVLAAFVGLIYGVVVIGIGSLIGGDGGGWTPVLATAVVALAFEPVRHLAQRWANRIAYGHRATPYEVLSDLTERLAGAGDGGEILERMAELLVDGTGADEATVWLGDPGAMRPVATTGPNFPHRDVDLDADMMFPVEHDGAVIGALEVSKAKDISLSSRELALLSDMAGSAGAVLGYRRLNESLATKAREIESSRRRLIEAEDQERRRLEHQLNERAQQLILALKVNIGLARRLAAQSNASTLVDLLDGLAEEAQAALDEVRNLARGIYPPLLESDGLCPAVSALAAGAPVEIDVSCNGIGRYSPEVEAAVYFDISEALTNGVKHASPPIRVDLAEAGGVLRFSVSDDGPGFDPRTSGGGTGLENLHDRVDAIGGRLEIISAPGEGTRVVGEIPLRATWTDAV